MKTKAPSKVQKKVNKLIVQANTMLYRSTGGKVLGRVGNLPILLLTTLGRKSGKSRTSALGYLPDGDRFVICGAYGGEPVDPAWCLNLRATPKALVEIGRKKYKVAAEELPPGPERDRLWQHMVDVFPLYGKFEKRTDRLLPIVVLTPTAQLN